MFVIMGLNWLPLQNIQKPSLNLSSNECFILITLLHKSSQPNLFNSIKMELRVKAGVFGLRTLVSLAPAPPGGAVAGCTRDEGRRDGRRGGRLPGQNPARRAP